MDEPRLTDAELLNYIVDLHDDLLSAMKRARLAVLAIDAGLTAMRAKFGVSGEVAEQLAQIARDVDRVRPCVRDER